MRYALEWEGSEGAVSLSISRSTLEPSTYVALR